MYEPKVGIVAIGRVRKAWDEIPHATPRYYTDSELREIGVTLRCNAHEYRIEVDWFRDLSGGPVDAMATIGYVAPCAVMDRQGTAQGRGPDGGDWG